MEQWFKEYCDRQNPYVRLLYEKAVECEARTIMELGVGEGNSTVALLQAATENDGTLWSIDVKEQTVAIEKVREHGLNLLRWTYVVKDDLDFIRDWNMPIDLLFIDTSHTYEQTFRELEEYNVYCRSGVILLHDTLNTGEDYEVMRAVKSFLVLNLNWHFTELLPLDDGGCGLGQLTWREE